MRRFPVSSVAAAFVLQFSAAQAVTVTNDNRAVGVSVSSTDIFNPYSYTNEAAPYTGEGEQWSASEGDCGDYWPNGCGRQTSFAYGSLSGGGMGFYAEGRAKT